jgi:5'-nucleotidase
MSILVTNDDGFEAIGIQALLASTKTLDPIMVAPKQNCSGMSAAISLRKEVKVKQLNLKEFVVTGTPADCSYFGLYGMNENNIEQVVSGINLGANLGTDVFYSGTVGAAIAGINLKYAPVAISVCSFSPRDISFIADKAFELIQKFRSISLQQNSLININFPDILKHDYKGELYTKLAKRGAPEAPNIISKKDQLSFTFSASGDFIDGQTDTDMQAIENGYVSVSILNYDISNANDLLGREISHGS